MLLHYEICICILDHSKFNVDWNFFFQDHFCVTFLIVMFIFILGLCNLKFSSKITRPPHLTPPHLQKNTLAKIKISDSPQKVRERMSCPVFLILKTTGLISMTFYIGLENSQFRVSSSRGLARIFFGRGVNVGHHG